MNDELKRLIEEYNQALANQSDKCEITLASKISSLGYRMGYDTLEQIIEDYDEENF